MKRERTDLAERAWAEFVGQDRWERYKPTRRTLTGPAVLRPVDEAPGVSTNGTAQWGLAAIQCMALIGDTIPRT